jgi:hypothetical protein
MSLDFVQECGLHIVDWRRIGVTIKHSQQCVLFMGGHTELHIYIVTLSRLSLRWPIVEKMVILDNFYSTSGWFDAGLEKTGKTLSLL